MAARKKILVVDDERDVLELYRELLSQLPSKPEIRTAESGSRALALLNDETYNLLLTDLNMPKMDGFQLLAITRRKFPAMKSMVMSGISDDQYRARAYGMGIDIYIEKPGNAVEMQTLADCVESLLQQESSGGFRGFQSMSLMDLIQSESMSGSSCVLKITNSGLVGKIWIMDGEVIDANAYDLTGEDAFQRILEWTSGSFERLPPDPKHERAIFNSVQGLLLDSAQTLDQAYATDVGMDEDGDEQATVDRLGAKVGPISRIEGVEFVAIIGHDKRDENPTWGVENPDALNPWIKELTRDIRDLGEELNAGNTQRVVGVGLKRHVAILPGSANDLCVGLARSMSQSKVRETLKEVQSKWAS